MNKPLTDTQKDIIRAFANNDMKRNKTAEATFFTPASIDYHLNKVHLKTGLNPRKFYDLIKLLEVCNGQEA